MFSATGPRGSRGCNSSFTGLWNIVCLNIPHFFQNPYPDTCRLLLLPDSLKTVFQLWHMPWRVCACVCTHIHTPKYKIWWRVTEEDVQCLYLTSKFGHQSFLEAPPWIHGQGSHQRFIWSNSVPDFSDEKTVSELGQFPHLKPTH